MRLNISNKTLRISLMNQNSKCEKKNENWEIEYMKMKKSSEQGLQNIKSGYSLKISIFWN